MSTHDLLFCELLWWEEGQAKVLAAETPVAKCNSRSTSRDNSRSSGHAPGHATLLATLILETIHIANAARRIARPLCARRRSHCRLEEKK
eukprot:2045619-Amphidinium_carterae.1